MIEIQNLLDHTDNGLDIIDFYYPGAKEAAKRKIKFKLRDEGDASASVTKHKNGRYYVKDFGDSRKAMDGIEVAMYEEGLNDFPEALKRIVERMNLSHYFKSNGKQVIQKPKAKYERVDKPDKFIFRKKDKLSDFELKTLGLYVTQSVCDKFNVSSIDYYITADGHKFSSTENYPIFIIDEGDFQKILQPRSEDKQYRFFYNGKVPGDYIYGLSQAEHDLEVLRTVKEDEGKTKEDDAPDPKKIKDLLIEKIIKCSGDRDALNMAGFIEKFELEYSVIWTQSEAKIIEEYQYIRLKNISKKLINIPDIDRPGIKYAHELSLCYLTPSFEFYPVYTVYLPSDLSDQKDFRGNPMKDLTDFLSSYKTVYEREEILKRLLTIAKHMRFWDYTIVNKKTFVDVNNVRLYYFLAAYGYFRYRDTSCKDGFSWIHLHNNVVNEVDVTEVADFVNTFLENRLFSEKVRNHIYRSNQIKRGSLENMTILDPDFHNYGIDFQYLHFVNDNWKITRDKIISSKTDDLPSNVWADKIIPHRVKITDPLVEVNYSTQASEYINNRDRLKPGSQEYKMWHDKFNSIDVLDRYELKINDTDFSFLDFILKTCDFHWRDKKEDKIRHTKEMNLHIINKLFAFGYLIHQQKIKSKAYAIYGMDGRDSEIGQHNGGSGKSLFFGALKYVVDFRSQDGQDKSFLENKHVFGDVTKKNDVIFIDDAYYGMPIRNLFNLITNDMNINPKHHKQITIPFEESPKIAITTNNTIANMEGSTLRRLLMVIFSDFWHPQDSSGLYEAEQKPDVYYGQTFFSDDWSNDDWNKFYNLCANCVQIALKFDKVDPPMININQRNLRSQIGQLFMNWADDYYSVDDIADSSKVNVWISKNDIWNDLVSSDVYKAAFKAEARRLTVRSFIAKLKMWCDYHGLILNPGHDVTSWARIYSPEDKNTVSSCCVATLKFAQTQKSESNSQPNINSNNNLPF